MLPESTLEPWVLEKMEGAADDKVIAYMLERDSADGLFYHQEWEGMKSHHTDYFRRHECFALAGIFR